MRMWGQIAIMALAAGWAQGVWACGGNVTVSFSSTSPTITSWNPLSNGTLQTTTFTVTVTKNGGGGNTKGAALIIRDTNDGTVPLRVGSAGGVGPIYTLTGGTGTSVTPTASNSIIFDLPNQTGAATNGPQTITLTVPANTASADFVSGNYSQTTQFAIQCYNNNIGQTQGALQTGTGPTLNVTIPALVSTITATPASINFGSFTQLNQPVALTLSSTGTINATISTANGNKMVLAGAQLPYPTNSTIPYDLMFEGQSVPATGATRSNLTRTGVSGGSKSLSLSLPAIPTGKLAGTYTDTITITMTPGT